MTSRSLIKAAFWIVLVHFFINLAHGWAHDNKTVTISLGQYLFVIPVIMIGPIAAYLLIRRGVERAGWLLLAATMAGSLVFGIAWHFIIDSIDHVSHVQGGAGATVFFWTSVALALIEAAGTGLGLVGFFRAAQAQPGRRAGATA